MEDTMKKLFLLMLCLFIAMSLVLTSCGGDKDKNDDKPGEGENNTPDDGNNPGEGEGTNPGEGEGNKPGEGENEGNKPGEGEGTNPGEGEGNKPGEGENEGDKPGEGENEGNKPGEGENEGNKPGEGDDTACDGINHTGSVVCEKCFTPLYTATLPAMPAINSVGMKITDFDVTMNGSSEDAGKLTATIIEAFIELDEEGMLQGYGKAVLKLAYSNYSRTDELAADVFIEDNIIYIAVNGEVFGSANDEQNIAMCVDVFSVREIREAMATLETVQPMIEKYLPLVENWITTSLLPIFENVKLDGASNIINKYAAKIVNSLYTVTENEDGTATVALTLENLKKANEALADNTIAELIDVIAGEGSFEALETALLDDKLYNFSVAELLNYLKTEQGVDLAILFEELDALAVLLIGKEEATLEMLLTSMGLPLPEGFDISALLTDEATLALSVKDALAMIMTDTETGEGPTPAEAVTTIKGMLTNNILPMLKQMSVYDILLNIGGTGGEGSNGTLTKTLTSTDEEVDPVQQMVEMVNSIIDTAQSYFIYTWTVNAAGVITSVDLSVDVDVDGTVVALVAKVTADQASFETSVVIDEVEVGTVSFVASKDKITVSFDMQIDEEASAKYTIELLPNPTDMTADAAKLAAIKTLLAKADGKITAEGLLAALTSKYTPENGWGNCKVFFDEESGLIYDVRVNGSYPSASDVEGVYNIRFSAYVTVIDPNDYFLYSVEEGCTGCLVIEPVFNSYYARLTLSTTVNKSSYISSDEIIAYTTLEMVKEAYDKAEEGDVESSSDSYGIIYNTATGEYTYNGYCAGTSLKGHDYEVTSSNTADTSCTAVYFRTYTCSVCNDSYTYYYSIGHSTYLDEELTEEPLSCNTPYIAYYACSREGCNYVEERERETDHLLWNAQYTPVEGGFEKVYGCVACGETEEMSEFVPAYTLNYVANSNPTDTNEKAGEFTTEWTGNLGEDIYGWVNVDNSVTNFKEKEKTADDGSVYTGYCEVKELGGKCITINLSSVRAATITVYTSHTTTDNARTIYLANTDDKTSPKILDEITIGGEGESTKALHTLTSETVGNGTYSIYTDGSTVHVYAVVITYIYW